MSDARDARAIRPGPNPAQAVTAPASVETEASAIEAVDLSRDWALGQSRKDKQYP